MTLWNELAELTSQDRNFVNLRNMYQITNPPVRINLSLR